MYPSNLIIPKSSLVPDKVWEEVRHMGAENHCYRMGQARNHRMRDLVAEWIEPVIASILAIPGIAEASEELKAARIAKREEESRLAAIEFEKRKRPDGWYDMGGYLFKPEPMPSPTLNICYMDYKYGEEGDKDGN